MSGDLKSRLTSAKLPERTVEICLRGDLVADFEDKDRQLAALLDQPADGRLVGNAPARKLMKEMDELKAEMVGSIEVFRLRAMKKGRWAALLADHPPLDDDEHQKALGYNPVAFFEDAVRRSIVSPADIDDETWESLLDSITDQQWNEFTAAAQVLNQRPVSIPFSRAALKLSRASDSE